MGRSNLRTVLRAATVVAGILFTSAAPLWASPINITTLLTGDPRPGSPDNLTVRVSVVGDTTSTITNWTVNLEMADVYPDARLDEFGFNLAGTASEYSFSNFSLPYTPIGGSLNGSGNTTFLLTLNDPAGNANDATNISPINIYSLSFTLTKTSNFLLSDFFDAPVSCSSDDILGCNQLAAHLQAVGANGNDSGVAVANYGAGEVNPVPEPGTMLLLGSGAVASFAARRRRKMAAQGSMA
jgi:hypothetical protein